MTISALQGAGPLLDLSAAARTLSSGAAKSSNSSTDAIDVALPSDAVVADTSATATRLPSSPAAVATQTGTSSAAPAATTADSSLFSEFKSYATASSQKSTAAYQEYVKAWGGRVVHGEVEFPPLSIYLE